MILLLALVPAVVVGMLRGGRLSRLTSLPLRWPAAPVVAFAAQAVVIYLPAARWQGLGSLHAALLVLSYLILLLTVWINRRIPGMVLLGLGLILNLAVMLANGGYMPMAPEAMQRVGYGDVSDIQPGARVAECKDVALPLEQTHLWMLSDIFVLPRPFPVASAFSPGDVLIAAGAFMIVQRALLGLPRRKDVVGQKASQVIRANHYPARSRGAQLSGAPRLLGGGIIGSPVGLPGMACSSMPPADEGPGSRSLGSARVP